MMRDQWQSLMSDLGLEPNSDTYDDLIEAYTEPHRHYHTTVHIRECLNQLRLSREEAEHPEEVELALWFHDAVYKIPSSSNEEKSADWAVDFLWANNVSGDIVDRVRDLVLVTKHDAEPRTPDESLIVDIDLAILGVEPDEYQLFEEAIRKEYRRIPRFLYWKGRRGILKEFLSREAIYRSAFYVEQFEKRARENLKSVLEAGSR